MRSNPFWITTGTAANAAFTALVWADPDLAPIGAVLAVLLFPQLLGLVLFWTGCRRAGARLVLVAAIAFVPLGLIAAVAARHALDDLLRQRRFEPQGPRS